MVKTDTVTAYGFFSDARISPFIDHSPALDYCFRVAGRFAILPRSSRPVDGLVRGHPKFIGRPGKAVAPFA
jgi:hypothetical protein